VQVFGPKYFEVSSREREDLRFGYINVDSTKGHVLQGARSYCF